MVEPQISCNSCGTPLKRDPETGDYICPKPGCGKGKIVGRGGETSVEVDEQGNIVMRCGGKDPSEN